MKKIYVYLFVYVAIVCTCIGACRPARKEIVLEEKEIVFLNYIPGMGSDAHSSKFNVLKSLYEPKTPETLYAFFIIIEGVIGSQYKVSDDYPIKNVEDTYEELVLKKNDYWTQEVLKIVEDTDLILLPNYPYCHYNQKELLYAYEQKQYLRLGLCAVAGTLDEIEELFDETPSFHGICVRALCAPRPDLLKKWRKQVGKELWKYFIQQNGLALIKN